MSVASGLGWSLDPPLDTSGDQARESLQRELARPEYHDTDIIERIVRAISDLFDDAVNRGTDSSLVTTVAAMVALVLLAGATLWLVGRASRAGGAPQRPGAVLEEHHVSAADLRARAEAAYAAGDHDTALLDGFRALTLRQIERGRLDDRPGATAHEIAVALRTRLPEHRDGVFATADRFDAVRYGPEHATEAQARAALDLEAQSAGRR